MKGKRNFMSYHIPRKEPKKKPDKNPVPRLTIPCRNGCVSLAASASALLPTIHILPTVQPPPTAAASALPYTLKLLYTG